MPGPESYRAKAPERDHAREQAEILSHYSPEEQALLKQRQGMLSSIGYFIGKDFSMPIVLNQPGGGWAWNFKENYVMVDPTDLLEQPIDHNRFIIAHEAGHRRISRTDFIPPDVWREPGFSYMMNSIEDPRDNNFVIEAYPKFKEYMNVAYDVGATFEMEQKAKGKMGTVPRFMQAGQEFIKQWRRDANGEEFSLDPDLPEDVQEMLKKTMFSAQDSWLRYPSKHEADTDENAVRAYAQASYEINLHEIWPHFKKLMEQDEEDQMARLMAEALENEQGEMDIPKDLEEKLTEEEKKELKEALNKRKEKKEEKPGEEKEKKTGEGEEKEETEGKESSGSEGEGEEGEEKEESESGAGKEGGSEGAEEGEGGGKAPLDLDSLSPELKKKLAEHAKKLTEEVQRQMREFIEKLFKELEKMLNEELEGKLREHPEEDDEDETKEGQSVQAGAGPSESSDKNPLEAKEEEPISEPYTPPPPTPGRQALKDAIEALLGKNGDAYEKTLQEVLPIAKKLEDDLRDIFVERRSHKWETGHKFGKKIDIKKRIQEKVKGVTAFESKAWQKREAPAEKDYAITLLVDLSGSMQGENITETFRAVVVLAEVLNALSINTEILGFNEKLYEYQPFNQPLAGEIREKMGTMLQQVYLDGAGHNDDGWAVTRASERLAKQDEEEQFLIVLSDGRPAPSWEHRTEEYELKSVVTKITTETKQKVIGLGIGANTTHVSEYYPNSLAGIPAREMAGKLADLLREAIANYDSF